MKTKLFRWLFLLGVMVVLVVRAEAAVAQPPGHIKALRVRGTVVATVKATSARTQLVENAEVSEGSTVVTSPGASVVLSFSNGASINLGTDSSLDIDQFTQAPFSNSFSPGTATAEPTTSTTRLKLNRGELVSKVAKLNSAGGSSFSVNTPVGAAGIRGTTFRIVYRLNPATGQAQFSLTTTEGSVAMSVNGTGGGLATEIAAGTQLEVTATVDVNGNVTVNLPSGGTALVATNVSTATTADIAASASVIVEAVANVVIFPPPPLPPPPSLPEAPAPIIQPINPTVVSPSQ